VRGIVVIFGDYRRLPDPMYAATTSGLRLSGCVTWVRTRPGHRRPVPVELGPHPHRLEGTPDAVDRAAVRDVIETGDVVYANYPAKRTHPYEKPPGVLWHILARVCRPGDLVLDPFAGSGSSRDAAEKLDRSRGSAWPACPGNSTSRRTGEGTATVCS
jgi:site-specific DNA-methyltransferase (adenine-specific)